MGLGSKESILENIATELEKITVANGYANDIQQVDRQFDAPEEGNYKYPSIFVNDRDEQRVQLLKDLFRVVLTVGLVLYVYDEGGTLGTSINSFIEDTKKALLADITRGGQARNTTITRILVDASLVTPPSAGIIMLCEVEYYDSD